MENKKLIYLDGLKGIGCVMVFLTHFVFAFYYGMYHYEEASCHLPGNLDIAIGKSPLNLLYNGNTAVRLFLVLSGYLLCLGYFRTKDKKRIINSAKKRYLRLMPPVLAVNLLIFCGMCMGLYRNQEAAVLAGSTEWFAGFNSFAPSFAAMLKESLYGCYLFGTNDYNGVLWTLKMLFAGAYLDYLLAYFIGDKKWRWAVYAMLTVLLLRSDFLGIYLGYVLCDLMHSDFGPVKRLGECQGLMWLCLAAGLYFMSYPSAGFGYEGTIWGILPFVFVNYYHILGVLLFVFAVLNLETVQKFLSLGLFRYLGRISYSLYLVHFFVIATLGAWICLTLTPVLGYNLTACVNLILISAVTIVLSECSVRFIEPLGAKGEKLLAGLGGK